VEFFKEGKVNRKDTIYVVDCLPNGQCSNPGLTENLF